MRTESDPDVAPTEPVLLYDGLCGFCDGMVQFMLRHDARGSMVFAALQGTFARSVLTRHPELDAVDSLVLIDRRGGHERISTRSEAVVRIWNYMGGFWRIVNLLRLVPRPLRDWGYDLFARHRHILFGHRTACSIPNSSVRARFID